MKKLTIIIAFLTVLFSGFSQEDIQTEYLEWAKDGNLEEVKKYLEKGADINAKSESGSNAGEYAIWNIDEGDELIVYLLDNGLDVNIKNEADENLLHIAAEYEGSSIIPKLVELGTDINARNEEGATPIIVAAENSDFVAVKVLSDQGADLSIENEEGKSVIQFFDLEEEEEWELLLTLKLSQKQKDILLYKSIYDLENAEKATTLIDLGANVNAKDEDGVPMIIHAADIEGTEIIQSLIANGVDVNAKDDDELNALWYYYDNSVLKILIDAGVEVNYTPEGYKPPLFRAIDRGNVEGVQMLLNAGANPKLKSDDLTAKEYTQKLLKLDVAPGAENYADPNDQKEHTDEWKSKLKEIAKLLE